MKKLLIALVVMASALSIAVSEAEAKRLGGGGSFGRQMPNYSRQAPAPSRAPSQFSNPSQPRPATPQPAPAQPAKPSPWRGMLGGALLGLGLGALLSHFGLGGAMAGMIGSLLTIALVVLAIMFVVRLFRGKGNATAAREAYAGAGGYGEVRTPEIGSRIEPRVEPVAFRDEPANAGGPPSTLPAGFDEAAFLRNAKTYFIRLQAAWDRADINDIREFTTPEMFGELRLQLQERGAASNFTDVVTLEAELLGVETAGDEYLASVRFTGSIREAEGVSATPFTEIWNLSKPVSGQGGWVLAGIQQL